MARLLKWIVIAACLWPLTAVADEAPAKGRFLVATEQIRGNDVFTRTVVLILQYGDSGAAGIVVNRLTEVGMDELLPDDETLLEYEGKAYWGGPVEMGSLRALVKTHTPPPHAELVMESVYLVPFDDTIDKLLGDAGSLRFFIGYAGWAPGQLEHELARGSWHVVPATADLVFAQDPAELWKRLTPQQEHRALLGVGPRQVSVLPAVSTAIHSRNES